MGIPPMCCEAVRTLRRCGPTGGAGGATGYGAGRPLDGGSPESAPMAVRTIARRRRLGCGRPKCRSDVLARGLGRGADSGSDRTGHRRRLTLAARPPTSGAHPAPRLSAGPGAAELTRFAMCLPALSQGDRMSDGIDCLPAEGSRASDPSPKRCSPATRLDAADGLRLYATRRPARPGPPGRVRQRPAERRSRPLLREPAHQSDERLHAAEHLRVLLVRAHAEGGGRVHPLAGGGVPRGGAGARHADARVPHRRRPPSASSGSSYYTDMLRGLKERHPDVHIKALTAVEIAHLARIERV